MKFAAQTTVPVTKTRLKIEDMLTQAGAVEFGYAADKTKARIGFRLHGRLLRFEVNMPAE